MTRFGIILLTLAALTAACSEPRMTISESAASDSAARDSAAKPPAEGTATATFGGGCFWCVEAVMEQLDGVADARSGYMGGDVENPSYEEVCSKKTGHIEVVQVTYDPSRVTYGTLLKWFFQSHDPTTKDRQGGDQGPQYRSAIFCHTPEQRAAAEAAIAKLNAENVFPQPVVTEVRDAETFWDAEREHQDFYRLNPDYGYCRVVIAPKLDKLGLDK